MSETLERPAPPVQALDLSYLEALPLVTYDYRQINVIMVGLGGTGSWLAPHAARVVKQLVDRGRSVKLIFIDHDIVEPANVDRQNFCLAEVGLHKARVLALRYGLAWGLDITAITQPFDLDGKMPDISAWGTLNVFVGCVDNARARQALAYMLHKNAKDSELPKIYWLDCGNTRDNGQVLLGSVPGEGDMSALAYAFDLPGVCTCLPGPDMQDPSLLVARPEELAGAADAMSCEAMAQANAQSLMINQQIAAVAADYLLRLLVTGNLKKFQTFVDLPSGTVRSTYITPTNIERAITGDGLKYLDRLAAARAQKEKTKKGKSG
jgi:PRTRC genetic system ThiF family protein